MRIWLLDTKSTCVIILFNISTQIWLLLQGLFGVNEGYIYYISGFARYDISSVELIVQWNEVVQLSLEVSTVLPPSTVPRGRPMPEGIFFNWWSYNNLVSLLCLWTYSRRLCSNLNYDHILEEHGWPDWFMDNWPIRVDPCLKSIYNYIYFIIKWLELRYDFNFIREFGNCDEELENQN